MKIDLGDFVYFAALLASFLSTVLYIAQKRKILYIVAADIIVWLITVTVLNNIFPMYIGQSTYDRPDLINRSDLIKASLFYGYPDNIPGFISLLIKSKYASIVFGLALGFFMTIVFGNARKPLPALAHIIAVLFLTEGALVLPRITSGIIDKRWNLENPLLTFIFYAVGYGLARLVLKLTPGITKLFDDRRKEEIAKHRADKQRLNASVKRSNKFEDI